MDHAKEYISEWPMPRKRTGRRGNPKYRLLSGYTEGELRFQDRLEAWVNSRAGEWEQLPENPGISKFQKSQICACGHSWRYHRQDGADRHDSACFSMLAGTEHNPEHCQCMTFRKSKKSSVVAQDKRSQAGPCDDKSNSALGTTERLSRHQRYYLENREAIRAYQRAYYQKRKSRPVVAAGS